MGAASDADVLVDEVALVFGVDAVADVDVVPGAGCVADLFWGAVTGALRVGVRRLVACANVVA